MKHTHACGAIALVALVFSSISCDDARTASEKNVVRIVAESSVLTKTQVASESESSNYVDIWWTAGDQIGVFGSTTNNACFGTDITTAVGSAAFSGTMNSGDAPLCAYYPYSDIYNSASDVRVTISENQTYETLASISSNDIKVSNGVINSDADGYTCSFRSLTSLLRFNIDLSKLSFISSDDEFNSITISSVNGRTLSGEFKLNASDATVDLIPVDGGVSSEMTLNVPGASLSSAFTAYANIFPGFKVNDDILVTVRTDEWNISFKVKAQQSFSPGFCYDIPLDISKATVAANDLKYGTKRQNLWNKGWDFNLAGTTFNKASNSLTEVLYATNTTINDNSLTNSIVFLEDGVTLTFGSSAVLENTIIVNNDEDGTSYVVAGNTLTANGNYVAFWDVDVKATLSSGASLGKVLYEECTFDELTTGLFSGSSSSYASEIAVNGCNWKLATDGVFIIDGSSATSTGFQTLTVTNNTFHSASASSVTSLKMVKRGTGLSFESVNISDNLFLNVNGSGDSNGMAQVASASSVQVNSNLVYIAADASVTNDIVIFKSNTQPLALSNLSSWYAASGADLNVYPSVCGSTESFAAEASESPLSSVNVASGTSTFAYPVVAVYSEFDGKYTAWDCNRTANQFRQLHSPTAVDYDLFLMPGASYEVSGSLPDDVTVSATATGVSKTYTLILSDYVDPTTIQTISSVGSNWTLIWTDEFNGTNWDHNVWTRCPADSPAWAKEQYPADESLAVVESGMLKTYAKKAESGEGANGYKAGGIWGKNLKSFNLGMNGVTGRIDVCATMSDATGYWPAIWMMPQQDSFSWPQWGEIDIMEHLNMENIYYATLHTWRSGVANQDTSSSSPYVDYKCSGTGSYTNRTSEHVFSVILKNDALMLALDGTVVLTCKKSDHGVTSSSTVDYRRDYWPYDATEYYLILDSQINGGWPGNSDGTNLPAYMNIQYVRYMVQE